MHIIIFVRYGGRNVTGLLEYSVFCMARGCQLSLLFFLQ